MRILAGVEQAPYQAGRRSRWNGTCIRRAGEEVRVRQDRQGRIVRRLIMMVNPTIASILMVVSLLPLFYRLAQKYFAISVQKRLGGDANVLIGTEFLSPCEPKHGEVDAENME